MPANGRTNPRNLRCTFCGKSYDDVSHMIKGPEQIYICDQCIDLCNEIIAQEKREMARKKCGTLEGLKTPTQLKAELDKYIVGQDAAKQKLAVACYQHQLRIASLDDGDVELAKANVLLLGPTGSGKTEMARVLAKILNVPFAVCDATSLTEAGYVGDDVENILLRLVQAADYDIDLAEKGIIYIDEIDKKARKSDRRSPARDISGEGVQQGLLKIIEGTVATVSPQNGQKHAAHEPLRIDTTNILFIFAGAFEGITDIVARRLNVNTAHIGFNSNPNERRAEEADLLAQVSPEDLVQFGLIPELVGRLPIIAHTNPLSVEDLVRIQTEPVNAVVRQFVKLFRRMGVHFEVEEEAKRIIAQYVLSRKTGARGLRSAYEDLLLEAQYTIPDMKNVEAVRLTADLARNLGRKLQENDVPMAKAEILRKKSA